MIEDSRRQTDDCEEQARILTAQLALLAPEAIIAFEDHRMDRLRESYRYDLWAVAFIINGGCSDDGFDYFRGWLIAQGRSFFEAALRTPERAAEGIPEGAEGLYLECERILGAANQAYRKKTGESIYARPKADRTPVSREPQGEPWDEDDLERLYPELARRFDAD